MCRSSCSFILVIMLFSMGTTRAANANDLPLVDTSSEANFMRDAVRIMESDASVYTSVVWQDGDGSLIDCAVAFGYTKSVRHLLRRSGTLKYDGDDESPLHFAAETGNVDIIGLLLDAGCPIDGRRNGWLRPVEIAVLEGNLPAAKYLAAKGAFLPIHVSVAIGRTNLMDDGVDVEAIAGSIDSNNRDSLHYAAAAGEAVAVEWLLRNGANVDRVDDEERFTPLHLAAQNGHLQCCKVLLDFGANVNQNESHFGGKSHFGTPLHAAALEGRDLVCAYLIRRGASTAETNILGYSPLHYAVHSKSLETLKVLVKGGCDINALRPSNPRYDSGGSALHDACRIGADNIVEYFIKHGATINVVDDSMKTPLHIAVRGGHLSIAKTLILAGANKQAKGFRGLRPVDLFHESIDKDQMIPSWLSDVPNR